MTFPRSARSTLNSILKITRRKRKRKEKPFLHLEEGRRLMYIYYIVFLSWDTRTFQSMGCNWFPEFQFNSLDHLFLLKSNPLDAKTVLPFWSTLSFFKANSHSPSVEGTQLCSVLFFKILFCF